MSNEQAKEMVWENLTLEQAQDVVEEYAPSDYFRDTYRAWESRYLPHICAVVENDEPGVALDIGPGWGTMVSWLASRGYLVGVLDNAPRGKFISEQLCQALALRYYQSSIEAAVIPTGFYDLVLMTQVLTHLKWRPDAAMRQVAKALAPGGTAIISVTDAEQYDYGEVPYSHWTDVPTVDSGAEALPNETICTYTEHIFEDLLRTAFTNVRITKPEGAQTLIAECHQRGVNDDSANG